VNNNGGDNGGDDKGDNGGGIRRLMPLGTISTISFNPLVVLVNKKGNLLLKA